MLKSVKKYKRLHFIGVAQKHKIFSAAMLIQAQNPAQKQERKLFKDFVPVEKPRPKAAKKPQFLTLKKNCHVLRNLTNRQKQFYLCLLSLTEGGLRPITKPVRWKTQRRLGIGWQAYFKMLEILKEKRFICYQKVIQGKKARPFAYSGIINTKKFLLVPLQTDDGISIFLKGFDIESYLNGLEKADRHPKQAGLPELFTVAKRTKRHRAANIARKALILKGRQKSRAHIESKDSYKTTETIHTKNQAPLKQNPSLKPLFKENSYMKHKTILFFDRNMGTSCRRLWLKSKIIIQRRQKLLASKTKLFMPQQPCLYRETKEHELIDLFAPLYKIPPREKPWSWEKRTLYDNTKSLETLRMLWKREHCPKIKKQLEFQAATHKRIIAMIKKGLKKKEIMEKERLYFFGPPPKPVTKESLLADERQTLEALKNHLKTKKNPKLRRFLNIGIDLSLKKIELIKQGKIKPTPNPEAKHALPH